MFERGSDKWWFQHLLGKLGRSKGHLEHLQSWIDGCPPVPHPDNEKPGFGRLQEIARVNVAELMVEARLHRLQLLGARTAVDSSADGDDVVHRFFIEQDLRRKVGEVFRDVLTLGQGFLVLTEDGVFSSSPMNTVVEVDAAGRVVAALTAFHDRVAGQDTVVLMRPGYSVTARGALGVRCLPGSSSFLFVEDMWEFEEPVSNLVEGVPVYPFSTADGRSIIEKHLPTLKRINHGVLQRLILIALQAFRQRALKNAPLHDSDGNKIDYAGVFESAPDSLWLLPEDVDVWESGQADLTPVLSAVKDDLRFLAVESKTPLYMISPDDANGSAEGAQAQRETLVFDVESLIAGLEGSMKRFLSDALRYMVPDTPQVVEPLGVEGADSEPVRDRADITQLQLIWANPRRSSISERAEAARAASQAGVPFRTAMEKFAELTPSEVAQAMLERSEDSFNQVVTSG